MIYNIDFEITVIIFLFLLLVATLLGKKHEGFQAKVFRACLFFTFLNNCLDVTTAYTIAHYRTVPLVLNYFLNGIFLSLQFVIPITFVLYVFSLDRRRKDDWIRRFHIVFIPAVIGILMVMLSPTFRFIYYFDEGGYEKGSLYMYLYVNSFIYMAGSFVYATIKRKEIELKHIILTYVMIGTLYVPVLMQIKFPNILLTGLGTGIVIFIMFLALENQKTVDDMVTGAMSRESFDFHISELERRDENEHFFAIALDNFKIINEVYSNEGGDTLMRMLVEKLAAEYGISNVYRFGGDTFVLTVGEEIESGKVVDYIRQILRRPFILNGIEVKLSACICLIHTVNHKKEDMISALEYAISQAKSTGKAQFFEVEEESVSALARKKAIEQAMMASILSGHFEVHYQPIYDIKKKRFCSMEALARLNVPGYGYVSPEEFIRIAEQNGTVIQIGMLVLDEVCSFIKGSRLKERGIDYVEVNLSVVQCMQEKIHRDVKKILEKYQIPADMINLEITESAAAYSEERLIQNMARLSLLGITFSLDDYGSGYSNINYLVDLPFTIVKIDKYFVWSAMKKSNTRMILESTIKMFKSIDLKVVTEGIEDKEMTEMVERMGADFIQGYRFSKPLPKEKLLDCLRPEYLKEKLPEDFAEV